MQFMVIMLCNMSNICIAIINSQPILSVYICIHISISKMNTVCIIICVQTVKPVRKCFL